MDIESEISRLTSRSLVHRDQIAVAARRIEMMDADIAELKKKLAVQDATSVAELQEKASYTWVEDAEIKRRFPKRSWLALLLGLHTPE